MLQLESVKGIDRKIEFASTQCLFIMQDGVKDEKEAKNVEKGWINVVLSPFIEQTDQKMSNSFNNNIFFVLRNKEF